jgi:hypothetical protein
MPNTLLTILLYFLASVFIVLAFMMLFAFRRSRRWELVLMSFVYSGAGIAAAYSLNWWPLIAGFIVAWLLKLAGFDPDRPAKTSVQRNSGQPPTGGA